MYADTITGSMERAIKETERRRTKQTYIIKARIVPQTVQKQIHDVIHGKPLEPELVLKDKSLDEIPKQPAEPIAGFMAEMKQPSNLEFERRHC